MIGLDALSVIVVSSLISAGAAILFIARQKSQGSSIRAAKPDEVVFLFDGRSLADATPAAREILPPSTSGMDDWGRFLMGFGDRFENLEAAIARIDSGNSVALGNSGDNDDGMVLQVQRRGALTRVALVDKQADSRSELLERYSLMALRAELETLRSIAEESPVPTWRKRDDGIITWANTAYMDIAIKEAGPDSVFGWPPPDLFASTTDPETGGGHARRRVSIPSRHSDKPLWFEFHSHRDDTSRLNFAVPIDGQVRAETTLSGFVQTLTKTFAHLTVGLAIFDRKRRLVLFNPALVDLTGLPAEQLSAHPTLHSFLDALRERQRIPEPKDYKSWRLQIAQLEAAAADGTYAQNWHLPNGQTYRVTGRPHPDGAVAYLFEDISSEVSLNRSFRSEIETGQAVLDNLDEAIAVFSANGILTVANKAYSRLWQVDHANRQAETSLTEAMEHWAAGCDSPDKALSDLGRLLAEGGGRRTGSRAMRLNDSRRILCTVSPLTGGVTMITFRCPDGSAHNLDAPLLSRVGT